MDRLCYPPEGYHPLTTIQKSLISVENNPPTEDIKTSHMEELTHHEDISNDEPSRKRTSEQVYYKHLFEQMKDEEF